MQIVENTSGFYPNAPIFPDTCSKIEPGVFYYTSDHLGSSTVITDSNGDYYEHTEYFPYGEVWVNERSSVENHDMPYKYTGKEYDPETKLTYYGARYYDAKLSRWISVDPPLISGAYLGKDPSKLPGLGGVFNPINLNAYHYAGLNPVKYIDPDGNYSEIYVEGNNINITIPVVFTGKAATQKNINRIKNGIENTWKGKFGNYTVTTTVQQVDKDYKGVHNTVNVKDKGRSIVFGFFDIGGNESFDLGTTESNIYEVDSSTGNSKDLEWISAHEAGHIMGLKDRYANKKGADKGWENNIMAGRTKKPDVRNIEQILKSTITNKVEYKDK
jgi:RHS repeat-associated protein